MYAVTRLDGQLHRAIASHVVLCAVHAANTGQSSAPTCCGWLLTTAVASPTATSSTDTWAIDSPSVSWGSPPAPLGDWQPFLCRVLTTPPTLGDWQPLPCCGSMRTTAVASPTATSSTDTWEIDSPFCVVGSLLPTLGDWQPFPCLTLH